MKLDKMYVSWANNNTEPLSDSNLQEVAKELEEEYSIKTVKASVHHIYTVLTFQRPPATAMEALQEALYES